jgi:lipoprotein NlpI
VHSFINTTLLFLLLCTTVFIQGCTIFKPQNNLSSSPRVDNLVIAEPLAINFKSEIAIARLTEVINRAKISDDQRAQFFYDRGVLFDSVGLRSLARFDFTHALKLKPTLIDAYNFFGYSFHPVTRVLTSL